MGQPEATDDADKPRLLIVDDSRIVRATIVKHIKDRYDFREESDGEAGWAAVETDENISVVISDIGMPKLDGYGFLERLRGSTVARIRDLPFVIISGDEDEAARQRAKALGATDFIAKGIGTAELLARLESLVKLHRTQGKLEQSREQLLEHPETGLGSRRFVELQMTQMLSHVSRHKVPASVLVLAFDRLDALNAQYGEPTVAVLVKRFGQMLAGKLRREDSFGHFDATTFVAVSPSTDEAGARVSAGRLREAVEQANVGFQGRRIPVTISVGLASCPPEASDAAAALLATAAARLRQAAEAGGNRIVGAEGRTLAAPALPRLETVLAALRAGNENGARNVVGQLGLAILPLLALADRECALGLSMQDLEAKLRERAQREKDARP